MSEQIKRVNLTLHHLESHYNEGGFRLHFHCNTPGNKKQIVVISFEFWWVTYLLRELKKQIRLRRESVDRAEKEIKGGLE